ncbi:MAG: FecR family protein [Saprospiraceae bacterium]
MSNPNKLGVFHKILHEAEHAQMPVHDNEAYTQLSDEDKKLFEQTQVIWDKSTLHTVNESFNTAAAFHKFLEKIQSEEKNQNKKIISGRIFSLPKSLLKYAAIFVSVVVATLFIINRPVQYEGGESGLLVMLNDQSQIWLNQNAVLNVKKDNKSSRKVTLEGEAFFDIIPNKEVAFDIQTQQMNISVLGTSFTLDGNKSTVDVVSGVVRVTANSDVTLVKQKEKYILKDEKWSISTGSGKIPTWANPTLIFDNAPFDQVVKDLEAFFNVSIQLIGENDWADCGFTSGSLSKTKFEDIVTVLKLTYEMEIVEVNRKQFRFSKVRCK